MSNIFPILNYTVPDGRVLYLKQVAVIFTGGIIDGSVAPFVPVPAKFYPLSILVNGSADVFNQKILVDPLADATDVMVIVPPGQNVKVIADFTDLFDLGWTKIFGYARINGDVLLENSMAAPYTALEVAGRVPAQQPVDNALRHQENAAHVRHRQSRPVQHHRSGVRHRGAPRG